MRQAFYDTQWMHDDAGALIGISLGHDFCAEHEWGARQMKAQFGVDDSRPRGVGSRTVRNTPNYLQFAEYTRKPSRGGALPEPCAMMLLYPNTTVQNFIKSPFECGFMGDMSAANSKNIVCAWDDRFFAVNVRGEDNVRNLKAVNEAFRRNDIAFGGSFTRWLVDRGLTFVIASKIPADIQEKVLQSDLDQIALMDALDDSGIKTRLSSVGRRWYALEPAWTDESKTAIKVFLNPGEQHLFNHGWFSLEDLEQWAEGHGPIVKSVSGKPAAARKPGSR